ncbi:MAG: hypothetical protein JF603_10145 [Acidobacteria bacterium]|nr:hypothetical protein [Acidobacteriota bacterium]
MPRRMTTSPGQRIPAHRRPWGQQLRRVALLTAGLAGGFIVLAPPAWAHAGATNDQAELRSIEPPVKGLRVKVLDRARIEVKNQTGKRVIVYGYSGEPFLRLERRSIYTNELSPATYLNRSLNGGDVPATADADAPPRWRRVATKKDGIRWHDHRLHRYKSIQTSDRWQIKLSVGPTPVVVAGAIVRDSPPAQWPWWLLGALAAAALVVAAQRAGTFLFAQVVAMGAGGVLPAAAALAALPAAGAVWFLRQPLAAGLVGALGLGAGLASMSDLGYAHMGVAVGDGLYRGAVVLCVCVGLGLVWVSALSVARPSSS